jgi:hypothetical protein
MTLKPPKYYRKHLECSKKLFQVVWEDFLRDSPNYESDEDILDYLNFRCSEYVNDDTSEFYLYG